MVSNDTLWRNPITGIGFSARAASARLAAPPMTVMTSRRLIEPRRNRLIDVESLALYDWAGNEKGPTIGPRRCEPMSEMGQSRRFDPTSTTSGLTSLGVIFRHQTSWFTVASF